MKKQILIAILILISFQIFGQQKSMNFDTLVIKVNEKIIVKIASYETGWLKYYGGFTTRIDKFKDDLSKVQNELPPHENLKLTSRNIGEIIVEIKGDSRMYKIDDKINYIRHIEANISLGQI